VGLGVEYQGIANTHWTFGTLSGSTTRATSNGKLSIYGEVQKGAGDFGAQGFDYSVVDAGVIRTFNQKFSLQVEDRQIDIFTTHGNLPQIQAAARWNPRWLTTVVYAHSVSGNLGTDLGSMRIDRYMPSIKLHSVWKQKWFSRQAPSGRFFLAPQSLCGAPTSHWWEIIWILPRAAKLP
jgi:hypothetical protein